MNYANDMAGGKLVRPKSILLLNFSAKSSLLIFLIFIFSSCKVIDNARNTFNNLFQEMRNFLKAKTIASFPTVNKSTKGTMTVSADTRNTTRSKMKINNSFATNTKLSKTVTKTKKRHKKTEKIFYSDHPTDKFTIISVDKNGNETAVESHF